MNIYEILSIDTILPNAEASSKESLLKMMLEILNSTGKVKDQAGAFKEIFDRERIMSTGVGKGIALPHAKTSAVDNSIGALITLSHPIDFNALDGNPVNIVFMLLGTEDNVGKHLKLLSKISRMMNNDDFRMQILHSKTSSEIYDFILNFESAE